MFKTMTRLGALALATGLTVSAVGAAQAATPLRVAQAGPIDVTQVQYYGGGYYREGPRARWWRHERWRRHVEHERWRAYHRGY